jgi:hypothetical protein
MSAAILSLALGALWHVDLGVLALREAWDINESVETLAGVAAGAERRVWRGVSARGEIVTLRVLQRDEDAWLRGLTLGTRMRWTRAAVTPFVDVAVGLSSATIPVPRAGTRFNYLAVIGAGIEREAGPIVLSVTARWLHASNNGREGRHLNPDIQSLGALVSVGWKH